ncbi:transglutaminase-like domain-containing protein [Fulvivirga sediminis]|uniref:Transglutaminase-like domain-containing protein n=1 Tax=Fulvivirga sediminis TaxID=2803949 RepID=A0A937K306_9BACT|nr:transglutaminase domain-containing protein [Fulvivirga sediminis]MBL3658437.1 hypothetical protein [Fulvivirga sediminis]
MKIIIALVLIFCWCNSEGQAVLVQRNTEVYVKRNSTLEVRESCLYQINNSHYAHEGKISIPYVKGNTKLLTAEIQDLYGNTIRKLKNKDLIIHNNFSSDAFHADDMVMEFDLIWHEFPYRIKYSYEYSEKDYMYVAYWSPYVKPNLSVESAMLAIRHPVDYEVYMDYDDRLKHEFSIAEDERVDYWKIEDLPGIEGRESFGSPVEELIPVVAVVPAQFDYGVKGALRSWSDFGQWIDQLNVGLDELTSIEKNTIDQLVAEVEDKREVVRTLYHYLQDNTRYINVDIDFGGMKPYSATYVCENKYGDCKALTNYMKAMLSYVNIPSYYTLVAAGENQRRVNQDFPSQQFNHVILMVPLEGDTIWLENTSKINAFNYLGTFTQNRHAFMVNGVNSQFVKTPALKREDCLTVDKYHYTINSQGNGKLHLKRALKGPLFEDYLYMKENYNSGDLHDYFSQYLDIPKSELMEWHFDSVGRDSDHLPVNLDFKVRDQFHHVAGMKVLSPQVLNMNLEEPGERKSPLRINYPINNVDSIIYEIDDLKKYSLALPASFEVESKFGRFELSCFHEDNKVIYVRRFELYMANYPLSEYKEFYHFIHTIKTFKKGSSTILTAL